jgi:hypothetical protein
MPRRIYRKVRMDPSLKTAASEFISSQLKQYDDLALRPSEKAFKPLHFTALRATLECVDAYDAGRLPVSAQKKLISILKGIVRTNCDVG